MKNKKSTLVFHHNDADGRMSATIIKTVHPDAEMVEIKYGYNEDYFIWKYGGKCYDFIFVVDFSLTPEHMELLQQLAIKKFVWVDHHKSAKEKLPELWASDKIGGLRDLNKSGCRLTWEWFNPHKKAPYAVLLVEDYDLWKFKYGDETKQFAEAVQYWNANDFYHLLTSDIADSLIWNTYIYDIIDDGEILLEHKMKRIEKQLEKVKMMRFEDYNCGIINSTTDISMLGNEMLEKIQDCEIALICQVKFDKPSPYVVISMRSKEPIDVSVIAKKYGGGGHAGSAGFEMSMKDFIKRYEK